MIITAHGTAYEITYAVAPYPGEATDYHRFQARTDTGQIASELYVAMDTLVIANVETASPYRGEGIATRLYQAALTRLGTVLHARPAHRTPEGDAWAASVGGDSEDADAAEDELEEVYA
ncbi:hypothetical protein [Allonocardiopsis opalescens]|uniref:N-acetyltransferase domain-containing protein n=1 Tax=Allonocardiopsis opalescens TaxID=1144618 RepID=A0A2T0PSY1_9ACTN|nr:hypothetical protein [Allonocardiopsis opalescens]PRX92002.1 hypothetical protein CLV72_11275 [Allonocardiopsis opalescens]